MGKVLQEIDGATRRFIEAQHVFFVATAPSGDDGHVNLSPKGYDTLRVLGPNRAAYLDLIGSGAETVAHLRQNGRITLLFCAFEGKPNLVRLYGRGEVVGPGDPAFDELAARFPATPGTRGVIDVTIERVSTSCGYAVPLMAYQGERPTLVEWAERRGPAGVASYQAANNATSIDGLPAWG